MLSYGQHEACQRCRGEYYLDLKTFSSSRSWAEIPVLTQTCRKRLGQWAGSYGSQLPPPIRPLSNALVCFRGLRGRKWLPIFHRQTRVSSKNNGGMEEIKEKRLRPEDAGPAQAANCNCDECFSIFWNGLNKGISLTGLKMSVFVEKQTAWCPFWWQKICNRLLSSAWKALLDSGCLFLEVGPHTTHQ